jgi:hypothetical protein
MQLFFVTKCLPMVVTGGLDMIILLPTMILGTKIAFIKTSLELRAQEVLDWKYFIWNDVR